MVPQRQHRAQAIVNAGTGAGIAVSGPVALLVAGSWRLAWAGFAVLAGDVITRWGLERTWQYSLGVLAVASASLGLFGATLPIAIAALATFGAAYITLTAVVLLWAVQLHPHQTAVAAGFGFLMLALGQAIAAPLVGLLVDSLGTIAALLACAAVGAVTARLITPERSVSRDTPGERDGGLP